MPLLFPRPTTIFDPPTTLDHFLSSPIKFLARHLHQAINVLRARPALVPHSKPPIKVICISDTHNDTRPIPPGDLLIHAGDLAQWGTAEEIQAQIDWLKSLPHTHKVVICGNHDGYFDPDSRRVEDADMTLSWGGIKYLENSSVTLTFPSHGDRQLVIYGAPQIPVCGGRDFAFQYRRDEDRWTSTVPMGTDILVTHSPPKYHLDLPAALGCNFLLHEVWRVRPTLHVFGHVHAGHGREAVFWDEEQKFYEKICARKSAGVVGDLFDGLGWLDLLQLVWFGLVSVLWTRIWGGGNHGSLMVNAALAYRSTGKLGNPVELVEV